MKFSDKLFFAMTTIMTLIFTIFGVWIMTSFFQKLLNRELEQGSVESRMFQYVFEMAYRTIPEEYGEAYTLERTVESVMENFKKDGNGYYIFNSDHELVYGVDLTKDESVINELVSIQDKLSKQNNYGSRVIKRDSSTYLLISVCRSENKKSVIYLAICKDISEIYADREVLLSQYRLILTLLLFIGTTVIFLLSKYITRPIGELNSTARLIAAGSVTARSHNTSSDEIGELADNFNKMADVLVERLKEKELEAKQKEDFTAAFAHELKTPLTSIIGYADMLNTVQMTDAEKSEAIYYIFTQGKRLERLSYKLLELVSLEKTSIIKKPVNTKELEEIIRNTMRPMLGSKQIRWKIMLEKGNIYADKDLLLSLLYNLLDNGCKAVEPGGFILLKGSNLKDGYEFKIVDNGRGIPREEISRITEAFYMVDKSRSRKEGGAGIGMALCQEIVRAHDGFMKIDSHPGEGTVVRILLPGKEQA